MHQPQYTVMRRTSLLFFALASGTLLHAVPPYGWLLLQNDTYNQWASLPALQALFECAQKSILPQATQQQKKYAITLLGLWTYISNCKPLMIYGIETNGLEYIQQQSEAPHIKAQLSITQAFDVALVDFNNIDDMQKTSCFPVFYSTLKRDLTAYYQPNVLQNLYNRWKEYTTRNTNKYMCSHICSVTRKYINTQDVYNSISLALLKLIPLYIDATYTSQYPKHSGEARTQMQQVSFQLLEAIQQNRRPGKKHTVENLLKAHK